MAETQVTDAGQERRYRTEIPNIVFSLGLSPYELTLYIHLKRTAGEAGACWKKTETLAEETGMSAGMVSKAKEGLEKPRPELNGKPLIVIDKQKRASGGKPNHIITLTDVWPENMNKFAGAISQSEQAISPDERTTSPHEIAISPHEIKKNPREEEPFEESKSVGERAEALLTSYSEIVGRDLSKIHHNTRWAWKKLIENRLKENWTDEQITLVWVGCSKDKWPDRPKFNAVTDLLSEPKRIDHFINLAQLPEGVEASGKTNQQPRAAYGGKPPVTRDFSKYPARTG